MRIAEWSGRPVGDASSDARGSQSRTGQQSQALGPAADQERHLGSLLDPLAARHARQRAHAEDLAEAGGTGGIRGAVKLGGRHAATDLGERLGDDWLLIHAVSTTAGPINQLLLGPPGLVALTTLHLNGTVHCRGDKWHAEKHPEKREISLDDHQGRSPSVALNQAADVLEKFLRSNELQLGWQTPAVRSADASPRTALRVERAVLIHHPGPGEDQWHRPTVHAFGSTFDFLTWLHKLPKILDRGQKRQIEKLILSGDHHHP